MNFESRTLEQLPPVLDAAQAAQIQRCSQKTVEAMLRDGELPGVKWGDGWALPTRAFIERLNELAIQNMLERRAARTTPPPLVAVASREQRRGNRRSVLPELLRDAVPAHDNTVTGGPRK